MLLNGFIFNELYNCITSYIYVNELTEVQREKFSANGSAIWFEKQFGYERNRYIYDLYLPKGTGRKYMITKKSSLGKGTQKQENVRDNVIIHILKKKLNRTVPEIIPKQDAEIERIVAGVLMQFFIKEKMRLYYEANKKYYEVYNEDTKTIIFENLNRKKDQSQLLDNQTPKVLNKSHTSQSKPTLFKTRFEFFGGMFKQTEDSFGNPIPQEPNVIALLEKYFRLIKAHDLDSAFKLWEQSAREDKFGLNPSTKFEATEFNKAPTGMVHIFDVKIFADFVDNTNARCKVFFYQDLPRYTSNNLTVLKDYTINEIDGFVNAVKALVTLADKNGIKEFGNLTLASLFDESITEELIPRENDYSDQRLPYRIYYAYTVSLDFVNSEWRIRNAIPIKTHKFISKS